MLWVAPGRTGLYSTPILSRWAPVENFRRQMAPVVRVQCVPSETPGNVSVPALAVALKPVSVTGGASVIVVPLRMRKPGAVLGAQLPLTLGHLPVVPLGPVAKQPEE